MRKSAISILTVSLLLGGCTVKDSEPETIKENVLEEYETYYTAVIENPEFQSDSVNYSISTEMVQVQDGSYRYYVIFDTPQTAMYDITIMVVENMIPYEETDKMMPSSGILETPVSMIPYQVNSSEGYVKGISLSGESDDASVDLYMLVQWYNNSVYTKSSREYIALHLEAEVNENE